MDELESLRSLLSDKQARVYYACLKTGGAKAPEIAKLANLKRTTVYGILDELVQLGFVNHASKGKQKVFRPKSPQQLIALLKEKQRSVEKNLPALLGLFSAHQIQPKVEFFEGKSGLKQIYNDVLESKTKKVSQIVKAKAHTALLGEEFVRDYIKKRVAKGIVAYDLHPKSGDVYDSLRGRENMQLKRYVRYLPPQIFHASMIMLYGNKVAMVSSTKENFGFIIESKEFSATLQAYFDFMWGLGSKEPDRE